MRAQCATQAQAVPLSSVVVLRSPLRHLCQSANGGSERSSPARRKSRLSGATDKENANAVHFAQGRACITPGGSLRVSPLGSNMSDVSSVSDGGSRADTPTKALTFSSLA